MADRSITIKLKALVTDFNKGMLDAAKATSKLKDETEAAETGMQAFGRAAVNNSTAFLAVGAALTAVAGESIKKFADFDQAMSTVASTGADAQNNIEALTAAAMDFGASTMYSATECANAITELAKAGLTATDILGGGLSGALGLAASEGMDVAEAAAITSIALQQFGLDGGQAAHVADLLAAGAGKAMGSAQDLGMALRQGGLLASQMGLSIEETVGALSAFAQAGLLGSDAGTSLKTMLQRLSDPSNEAKAKMDELGISAYDAAGEFVGLENFAGQLTNALGGLTPQARNAAMSLMFGSDAVRAANVLYAEGADGIHNWIAACDDWGYAAMAASTKTNNLKGDLERLGGSFDTIAIKSGSGLNSMLRGLVQTADDFLNIIGMIPAPVLATGTAITGLLGVGALGIGTFGKLLGSLNEFVKAGVISEATLGKLGGTLGTIGKAAGIAGLAIAAAALEVKMMDAIMGSGTAGDVHQVANALQQFTYAKDEAARGKALDDLFTFDYNKWNDGAKSMSDMLADLTFETSGFLKVSNAVAGFLGTSDVEVITTQIKTFDDQLAAMVASGHSDAAAEAFNRFFDAAIQEGFSADDVGGWLSGYLNAAQEARTSADVATQAAKEFAAATGEIGPLVDAAAEAYGALSDKGKEAAESIMGTGVSLTQTMDIISNFGGNAEAAAKQFGQMANVFASSAAEISNAGNAWDAARGKSEKPPSMKAWIQAMHEQVEAYTQLKNNTLSAFEQMRTELPANLQAASQAFLMSIQGDAQMMKTFAEASDDEQREIIETWAQTGEYAGTDFATKLAAAILSGEPPAIEVKTETGTALTQVNNFVQSVNESSGTVQILGDDGQAQQVRGGVKAAIDSTTGAVTILGNDGQAITTLATYKASIDNTTGIVTIEGTDANGRQVLYTFKGSIDTTSGTVTVKADAAAGYKTASEFQAYANSLKATVKVETSGLQDAWQSIANRFSSPIVQYINTVVQGGNSSSSTSTKTATKKATGGAITGGTPGKDSVLSLLMPGEHVLTTADVTALGGQSAVYALRAALHNGVPRYQDGGAVGGSTQAPLWQPAARNQQVQVSVKQDPHTLVSALDGANLTLLVDGQPIKAIIRNESVSATAAAVNQQIRTVRRGGRYV